MWFTYIIRSQSHPGQRYIGLTKDLSARLGQHNEGSSPHTSKFRPWALETVIGFNSEAKASAFERYLKTGSGFAFSKRHF